jgi:hypothetical protein
MTRSCDCKPFVHVWRKEHEILVTVVDLMIQAPGTVVIVMSLRIPTCRVMCLWRGKYATVNSYQMGSTRNIRKKIVKSAHVILLNSMTFSITNLTRQI